MINRRTILFAFVTLALATAALAAGPGSLLGVETHTPSGGTSVPTGPATPWAWQTAEATT